MIYCSFCIQHGEVFVNHIVHSMQKSGSTNLNSLEGTSSFLPVKQVYGMIVQFLTLQIFES